MYGGIISVWYGMVSYQIVIYTASLSKYADPLLDKLDKSKVRNSDIALMCGVEKGVSIVLFFIVLHH